MNAELLRNYYAKRGFDQRKTQEALRILSLIETFLINHGETLDTVSESALRQAMDHLISKHENSTEALLALARYFYLVHHNEAYVYMARLTGGLGVIESIAKQFDEVMAPLTFDSAIKVPQPPLGSDPSVIPAYTDELMRQIEAVADEAKTQAILCGNHHGLSPLAFSKEKERYQASPTMEAYLKDLHDRKVKELQEHCDHHTVWFEQTIDQATVDFVAANPELLSARLENNTLYLTKIPYDPARYLQATDPIQKRYYACHCPFAREAILKGTPHISKNWCHCSAGFEKFHFETILDRKLEVNVLSSALQGDPICRFAIPLESHE